MIVSGWLGLSSVGNDEVVERWTAEVDGSDVLARIALSAYTQGASPNYTSFANATISGYSQGHGLVNLGRDFRNNAYYISGCATVQFDLWGRFVRAYAHAATFPLSSRGHFHRLEHMHRRYAIVNNGTVIAHHRISALARESKLDAGASLSRSLSDVAAHQGLAVADLTVQEVDAVAEALPQFVTP